MGLYCVCVPVQILLQIISRVQVDNAIVVVQLMAEHDNTTYNK